MNLFSIIFGYILSIIHFIFIIIILITPYFTDNIYLLLLYIIINNLLLTQWYLLGNCFLNNLENYFLSKNNMKKNTRHKSIFAIPFELCFSENNTHILLSLIPLINSIYAYIKIINFLQNKNIFYQQP
jgi:hypothetical protein